MYWNVTPVAHCVGNDTLLSILLNNVCSDSNNISAACLKYSFTILSIPLDLFVLKVLIAVFISNRDIGSSNFKNVASISVTVLSKLCIKYITSSGLLSDI